MSRLKSAALLAGALVLLFGIGIGAHAVVEHGSARGEYEAERARLGEPGYDARRSDALYERTLEPVRRAKQAGWLAGLGWVLVALAVGRPRPRRLSALLDLAVVVGLIALYFRAEDLVGPARAALGGLLATQAAGAALGWAWLRLRLSSTAG